ncbi:hypothetical protein [Candidatus Legionella polyplacis]|uniref:Uncharacterized protein n=1 Tax=Candidatus Legionella polyplacis TaxID=2005262 RepID=A0ABZ2H076_9GAMM
MNKAYKEIVIIGISLGVLGLTLQIVGNFIPSIIWAFIIGVSTYPVYMYWRKFFGCFYVLSAFVFTIFFIILFLFPLIYLLIVLLKELQVFITYLQKVNYAEICIPVYLKNIPIIGNDLISYWNNYFNSPNYIKNLLYDVHLLFLLVSSYIKKIGMDLFHRGIQFIFTVLILFFFIVILMNGLIRLIVLENFV